MTVLIRILVHNVLPAFAVMAVGVLADRLLRVDKRSLSRLAIYILTPCLIFANIVQSSVAAEQFGRMIAFVLVFTGLLCALALGVGGMLRWPRRQVDALVLSVAFVNAGNFGLSVILFSFGQAGLELGTVFFVASNFVINTLGVFFALRSNGGAWRGLLGVFKLPGLYAFGLALLLRTWRITLPEPLMRPLTLLSQATVPIMLLLLGMQLSQTRLSRRYGQVAIGALLRLIAGAGVALGLAPLCGLQGLARQVAIVEAATPTAVNSALMAIEFDADADYVTSVILVSTLLSSLTLTALLYWLG